jgi:hypothetical protein
VSASELSPVESVKVRAFGLDDPAGAEAGKVVAMIDEDVRRRGRPLNGDGSSYVLGLMRDAIVRRFPEAEVEV